jgi:flagellar motor switch protein FliM
MDNKTDSATIYDFVHPGHKLKTEWPVLELVNGRVGNAFAQHLSERLQVAIHAQAAASTRAKYTDFVSELAPTMIVHEISLGSLPGVAWFCIDASVVAAILDAYFGGEGKLQPTEAARQLSPTEQRVMQHILDALLGGMRSGWSIVHELNPAVVQPIQVDRLAQASQGQVVVANAISLNFAQTEADCLLAYPYSTLEPISEHLQRDDRTEGKHDDHFSAAMRRGLMDCDLEIRGVLAESRITLGKLLELKPGDFIPLRDVQTVSFKTQHFPLFDARVGKSNGRVSASLSRWRLPVQS